MSSKCQCHFYIAPLILIILLVSTYHIYMVGFCYSIDMSLMEFLLYLTFFNLLFVMTVWSLLYTMFTPAGKPTNDFKLTEDELNMYAASAEDEKNFVLLEVYDSRYFSLKTRMAHGQIRYCKTCQQLKPDRAHHCAKCGVCVLKMDHHCPWLKNCIGYYNHKAFLLCLFYCTTYCIYIMGTTYIYFSDYWQPTTRKHLYAPAVVIFFLAAIIGSITGIFFCFHLMLLLKNRTAIENLSNPSIFVSRGHTFDLGFYRNITAVLGRNWLTWLIPGFSSEGDGCYFETRKLMIRRGSHTSVSSRLSRFSIMSHTISNETRQRYSLARMYMFDLPASSRKTNETDEEKELNTLFEIFTE